MDTPSDPKAIRAAIKNFRRLLELEPRHRGHREQLARLYEADAQPKAAIREWLGLARDLAQDAFLEEAIAAAREALRVEPGHAEAQTILAAIYAAAPRSAHVPTATAVVDGDPLDEIARPERDVPLDALALVRVHSADEVGAELASQSSVDISVTSFESTTGSFAVPDRQDRQATVDYTPAVAESSTIELSDDDLLAAAGDTEAQSVAPVKEPSRPGGLIPPPGRGAVATRAADDPLGTVDVDVELFNAADESGEAHRSGERAPAASGERPSAASGERPSASGSGERLSPTASGERPAGSGLPRVPLLAALPRASVQEVLQRADRRFFPAGSDVLCHGDPADGLYVVVAGTVRVSVRGHDGRTPVEVGIVEPGGYFGEVDLIEEGTSQIHVTAVDDVEILKIGAEKVAFLRKHYPAFERTLDESAELRSVNRYLARSVLFGGVPARDRTLLASRFRPIALGPGEELFVEGAAPEGLYLVTRGSLVLYRDGETLTNIPAGEFVGVVSMLRQEPARCTALAGPSAQVVCLDPEEVELVLSSWQSVREAFWREARTRDADA